MAVIYPNLPLIEERFANAISPAIEEKREEAKESDQWYFPEFIVCVFPQTFPNSAGIFESGGFTGQAITRQYITVIREADTGIYGVFGDNRLAYIVKKPGQNFFNDLKHCKMETWKNAVAKYGQPRKDSNAEQK